MREVIRAGTTALNSDTGEELADKINRMTEELYNALGDSELPTVKRISRNRTVNGHNYWMFFELDKPAPANCYLQFWRFNKRGARTWEYRPVQIFIEQGGNTFPIVKIPEEQDWIGFSHHGSIPSGIPSIKMQDIIRPPMKRGGKYKTWEQYAELDMAVRHNPPNGKRDSKTKYKFATCQYVQGEFYKRGFPSDNTVIIPEYYQAHDGSLEKQQGLQIL